MIEVKGLYKNYGQHQVLKGIDFHVKKGEIYGFLGQNGAGKSTTMNILTGLIDSTKGEILIDQKDMKKNHQQIMEMIGYLPEDPQFYTYMKGREYLSYIGKISGYSKGEIEKRNDELLELVGLKEGAKRRIGGYSRGMRQRLGLAVAVYNQPKILFLDEPSSALDPEGRREILDIIYSLKDAKTTIFLSTHILSDVEKTCDRIGILHGGKMVLEEDLETLMEEYVLPIYEIEFDENCEQVKGALLENWWVEKVETKGRFLSVFIKDRKQAKENLLKVITGLEVPVLSYRAKKTSLEDIFIKAVKKHENI
ncbi:ABC transporter ATP-binding protein [Serpentinicella sp. ANB-PHB4]|uniref:ABC transporter ATP-binding protein n=1 Tax=Serpentinicella sp. ANB-PHB4 TaxID=3074076 RepID=UPI002861C4C3|nr:ABC transporter ATP-binding protein [Serpentinicella sp. ANB-PHB4]MDR5659272.1 ABC transporter ATP-binding protein [Serpentinicella sp. ANB-PHB4]